MQDKTLPLMVATLFGDRFTDYGQIYTGLSMALLPLIIVFAFLQKYIIQGVTAGSVKE
jgi:ABC-type glycerol-3-phosphate transport system permease component